MTGAPADGSGKPMRRPRRAGIPTVTRVEVETDRGVFMISVAASWPTCTPRRCGCTRRAG